MSSSILSTAMSAISQLLPRSMIEARTRCMRTMMPHALEQVLLPRLSEAEQAEFIERMVNILLVGASRRLCDEEWDRLVGELHDRGTLGIEERAESSPPQMLAYFDAEGSHDTVSLLGDVDLGFRRGETNAIFELDEANWLARRPQPNLYFRADGDPLKVQPKRVG